MKYISTKSMSLTEWRQKRAYSIGASEAGAIMSLNPYKSPLDVYLEKTGEKQPDEENLAMTIGTFMEPLARRLFTKETGLEVRQDNKIRIDPVYDFLTTNLDGMIVGEKVPLEIKTATQWNIDEISDWYYCQLQMQLMVTGAPFIYFAVIVLGYKKTFVVDRFPRNDAFIKNMRNVMVKFWTENVLAKVPPDPITYEEAQRVYPIGDPEKIVEAPSDVYRVIALQDKRYKSDIKILKKRIEAGNVKMSLLMKDAKQVVTFEDEVLVTWKNNKDSEKFDLATFEKENPLLFKKYQKVMPGARVLRFNKNIGEQVDAEK